MKLQYIPLTQGQYARVDEKNWGRLMQYSWFAKYNPSSKSFNAYRNKHINGKKHMANMAREILNLKLNDRSQQADHLSHDTLDNRECNLRIVTCQENQHNSFGKGYKWKTKSKRWETSIKADKALIYLGYYHRENEILAAASYLTAKQILHPTAPMKILFRLYCKKYNWDKHDLRQTMNRVEKKTLQHITRHKAKHP